MKGSSTLPPIVAEARIPSETEEALGSEKEEGETIIDSLRRELQETKDRIAVLEDEKSENTEHCATTQKSLVVFVQKALATVIASTFSNIVFTYITAFAEEVAAGPEQQVVCRAISFGIICLLGPILYILTKNIQAVVSDESWIGDALVIFLKGNPMLMGWGFKDLVAAVLTVTSDIGDWNRIILAIAVTLALWIVESTPCYKNARKSLDDGEMSIWRLYLTIPGQCHLGCGYAWNQLFRYPITHESVLGPDGQPKMLAALQAAYTFIVTWLITRWTSALNMKQRELDAQPDHSAVCDLVFGLKKTFIGAMKFVYGWALSDLLNDIVFSVYCGCASPVKCSYQSNFAYGMVTLFSFAYLSSSLIGKRSNAVLRSELCRTGSREYAECTADAANSLTRNSLSLIVGWAWSSFVSASNRHLGLQEHTLSAAGTGTALFTGMSLVLVTCYHVFMENCRSPDIELEDTDFAMRPRGSGSKVVPEQRPSTTSSSAEQSGSLGKLPANVPRVLDASVASPEVARPAATSTDPDGPDGVSPIQPLQIATEKALQSSG